MDFIYSMICVLFLMLCKINSANAQVDVISQQAIITLTEQHISSNKNLDGKLKGYRVQIFFDSGNNSRIQATNIRNEFASRFPKISTYIIFKEPNFRVRVGDFRTRSDARGFQQLIVPMYPQSFVVKDDIYYPKHIYEQNNDK
ncbi:MAG TPA: SPOR domain-containing protein [Bacteroidales bacterium]|nr:SPOR domain-containing protein [Bacteroidales bacterium]